MTDATHTSTEYPPAAAGTDLVPDAEMSTGPAVQPAQTTTITGTENPPHDHGATVVADDQTASTVPEVEAPAQSPTQSGGLHAADVAPLVEPEVG